MKRILLFSAVLAIAFLCGCKKSNYPGGVISPYISIYDLRSIYKGSDVTLTTENMLGSHQITGVVVSDHSGQNLPAGLLVLQDRRRLSQLRGISVAIGATAASFLPGDSIVVDVTGGVLKKDSGRLIIAGLSATTVKKISSGNVIPPNRVPSSQVIANPEAFESTLIVVVKAGFSPLPSATDILAVDKVLNDGFGELGLHTEATATFASNRAPFSANFYGIIFNTTDASKTVVPQLRLRTGADVVVLSSAIELTPVIISGFMADVAGGDGNYEYVQLKATADINFATSPHSVIFTNNATAGIPTGYPVNGWAMGGMRTFKFNLTTGSVTKGSFFYVGGAGKLINGATSTDISSSNWVRSFNYVTTDGDGFGTKTSGLLANSGNASGIAVFAGTTITATSAPIDVIFVGTGGSLYNPAATPQGYRIANTDFYDIRNPITLENQPFYRSGSNTLSYTYNPADLGIFNMLGGEYNAALGRWMKARAQRNVQLTKTSPLAAIEGDGATVVK